MNRITLIKKECAYSVGDSVPELEPNIFEDTIFVDEEGNEVGVYVSDVRKYHNSLHKYIQAANRELVSDRVPKGFMKRSSGMFDGKGQVKQYSTTLGYIAERAHMRRPYVTISSVHGVKSAEKYVKLMLVSADASMDVLKKISPSLYRQHIEAIQTVDRRYRFGKYFTSSIANVNTMVKYHYDKFNVIGSLNFIYIAKRAVKGGDLSLPEYGAVLSCGDNSLVIYPAWRDMHGVTPAKPLSEISYRNSLVFYSLNGLPKSKK